MNIISFLYEKIKLFPFSYKKIEILFELKSTQKIFGKKIIHASKG